MFRPFNTFKILCTFIVLISIFVINFGINSSESIASDGPSFGILVPLEHEALKDIVEGFTSEVKKQYPNAQFNIQNAQGDVKLQRAIIEQFMGQDLDFIIPIGTTTTQMTLSVVKDKPIISLAAEFSEADRQKRQPQNITGVLDEIGGQKKIEFIKKVYPNIKKLTVIFHTGNEKNFKEVEDLINYGKKLNITVKSLSVHALPDLETVALSLDKDSEAILILKDHLIASGIRMLIPIADSRQIPLITSDEGTVKEGATFALGMQEKAIGEAGGDLAIQLLEGMKIEDMPMQAVKNLSVFYNNAALKKHAQHKSYLDIHRLKAANNEDGYPLISY